MTSDLATPQSDASHQDLATVAMTWATLVRVCNTELVPKQYRGKPDAALGAILMGREQGLQPMQSLNLIDSIDGRPSLSAELMNAMVRKAGHAIRIDQYTAEGVTLTGTRHDTGDTATVSFDLADAQRAGLAGKRNWQQWPADMCWARAISRLCRVLFPDVLTIHSYTPADLDADAAPESPPADLLGDSEVVEAQVAEVDDRPTGPGSHDHGDGEACWCDAAPGVTLVDLSDSMEATTLSEGHTAIPGTPVGTDTAPTGTFQGNQQPGVADDAAGESHDGDSGGLDREQLEVQLTDLLAVNVTEGTMADIETTLRALCRIASQLGVVHGRGQLDYLHAALADVGAAHVGDLRRAELIRLAQSVRGDVSDKFVAWITTADPGDDDDR